MCVCTGMRWKKILKCVHPWRGLLNYFSLTVEQRKIQELTRMLQLRSCELCQ